MGVREKVKNWLGFGGKSGTPPAAASRAAESAPRTSGRISVDGPEDALVTGLSFLTSVADDPENYWRDLRLDAKTLSRVPTKRLVELLVQLSPEVSRARWDYLRLCNPGYSVKVYNTGSLTVHEEGQRATDEFLARLHGPYTEDQTVPADTVINSIFTSGFMRGGLFAELVMDEDGRTPLDIAAPDPASVSFRRVSRGKRGKAWQLGQWQGGEFVALNRPTVAYVPIDPLPGNPHGTSMVNPAIFTSLFLLGLLHDLRRVVAQQGYPRWDIKIITEKLLATMPKNIVVGSKEFKEWVEGAIRDVVNAYDGLEPDDALVHTDATEVGRPVGTVDASSLGAVDGLIRGLERMLTRALKTYPVFFGTGEAGGAESSNRQWELMAAGVKSLQHLCENLLERLLTLALRAQGIEARVVFRFSELRTAELLRDAQVARFQILNAKAKYDYGWISQDEAAFEGAGKEKSDSPEPRKMTNNFTADLPPGGLTADPGSERSAADELLNAYAAEYVRETEGTAYFMNWLNGAKPNGGGRVIG